MDATYSEFYRRSIEQPDAFWMEQAKLIHWQEPFSEVLDYSNPPFARWFCGGVTNLCYNAVDRHLRDRADQPALIHISTETNEKKIYTYAQLHDEVNRCAAALKSLGVRKGDRVLIYLPMIAEAVYAMLATVRLGAIHSVVFGGFASHSLATRIDDAKPKVIITADAGMRGGKVVRYKHLVDEALRLCEHPPRHVVIVNRGLDETISLKQGHSLDNAMLREAHANTTTPVTWVESNEPSYILYTSGTTGKPKGVQRDTGGYAVALAASMRHIYCANPGETFFCTSDIGWVVGHSYIVYGPLLNGMTTVVYEGLPTCPDAGVWWKIVQDHRVSVMFSSPTAIRVLKKQAPSYLTRYDLSSLRYLFLAGEPLDETTARWISESTGAPVIDHYWQTETGWAILSSAHGVEKTPTKFGSPSFAAYGYDVKILDESTGAPLGPNEKGVVTITPPLPPGCLSTIWGQDDRFVKTYFTQFKNSLIYSTFDWGIRDEDGYYFILGRTDDVINVAGHRLGTREIEEAISTHSNVAEVAVVGAADEVKGQTPLAFVVAKDSRPLSTPEGRKAAEKEVMAAVDQELGAIARPASVHFVAQLPKTRSGKLLRRSIQAIAEGRDPGDLTTLDDMAAIEHIRAAVSGRSSSSAAHYNHSLTHKTGGNK